MPETQTALGTDYRGSAQFPSLLATALPFSAATQPKPLGRLRTPPSNKLIHLNAGRTLKVAARMQREMIPILGNTTPSKMKKEQRYVKEELRGWKTLLLCRTRKSGEQLGSKRVAAVSHQAMLERCLLTRRLRPV